MLCATGGDGRDGEEGAPGLLTIASLLGKGGGSDMLTVASLPGEDGAADQLIFTSGDGERSDPGWPVSPLVRYSFPHVGVLLPEAVTTWISGREGRAGWLCTSSQLRELGRELADSQRFPWLGEEGVSGILCGSSMLCEEGWSVMLSVSSWEGDNGGTGWPGHS